MVPSDKKYRIPLLAVDAIIIKDDKILLVKRKKEPFAGYFALPGGFVHYGEETEEAVIREVKEETGLRVEPIKVFNVYSNPQRDPRGHIISICYLAQFIKGRPQPQVGEIADVSWYDLLNLPTPLAFDHQQIIDDYLKSRHK